MTIVTINNDPTLQLNGFGSATKALMKGLKHSSSGLTKGNKAGRSFQAKFLKSIRKTYGPKEAREFYKKAGLSKG